MRKVLLLATFSFTAPLLFLTALIYLLSTSSHGNSRLLFTKNRQNLTVSYAALPSMANSLTADVTIQEGRTEMLKQFFAKYKSPLLPYADYIVSTADKYELDFRLIPAIAMQESNLCKRIPVNSHNCWGFGIYGGKVTRFSSYPAAIETVTKTLALKYKEKNGLVTPEQIMSMYTPSSNGSWARGVNHFMEQLQ